MLVYTTHQASWAGGWGSPLQYLHRPTALLAWWVVIPQHVAPNLELLFLKNFNGTIIFSVQFSFHLHVISRRGVWWNAAYNSILLTIHEIIQPAQLHWYKFAGFKQCVGFMGTKAHIKSFQIQLPSFSRSWKNDFFQAFAGTSKATIVWCL